MIESRVSAEVYNLLLKRAIDHSRVGVTITDPNQADNPIIFVNEGFLNITGYEEQEIIGKNCRFLQGTNTNKNHVSQIRRAIKNRESVSVEILNYRKDGMPFRNDLHIEPVFVEQDDQYYFIGTQKDISEQRDAEENLKNSLKEITALSTPIVPIAEGVSVLPLIGNMDWERLDLISDNISKKIAETKDQTLILELSGLSNFEEEVIRGIFRLSDMLALLGSELIITGITPDFAIKSTEIQMDLSSIKTFSTVKEAIQQLQTL